MIGAGREPSLPAPFFTLLRAPVRFQNLVGGHPPPKATCRSALIEAVSLHLVISRRSCAERGRTAGSVRLPIARDSHVSFRDRLRFDGYPIRRLWLASSLTAIARCVEFADSGCASSIIAPAGARAPIPFRIDGGVRLRADRPTNRPVAPLVFPDGRRRPVGNGLQAVDQGEPLS